MIELEVSAACDIGCVRENNEDMILVGECFLRNESYTTPVELGSKDRFLFAIADGMGGHNSGEVASSISLHNLQFFFNDIPSGLTASGFNESIVDWLESINNIIDSKGLVDKIYKGMGTTLVGIAYYNGDFYSMNCGDSRLYRYRDGNLCQMTTDHSLDNMMGVEKHSSIITNCIGGGCKSSYIDIVQMTHDIHEGDVYLLCSDGLSDMMSNHHIATKLAEGSNARALCDEAIALGGLDNISVCKIEVKRIFEE